MDYSALASELLEIRAGLLPVPATQQLSQMVKGELFVLNYLLLHEGIIHPKELSEKMAVSTARIASLLNHMEEKHYIERCHDQEDNRQTIVRLTKEGREAIHHTRQKVLQSVADMLEDLGPEDAEAYVRIQKKILAKSMQSSLSK